VYLGKSTSASGMASTAVMEQVLKVMMVVVIVVVMVVM
jgi:hypothetical protein